MTSETPPPQPRLKGLLDSDSVTLKLFSSEPQMLHLAPEAQSLFYPLFIHYKEKSRETLFCKSFGTLFCSILK